MNHVNITLRKFEAADIPNKVRWINDPLNNEFLHYDLPLELDKTTKWFEAVKDRPDRFDAVIEADGVPVGLIGLLNIDTYHRKAEYYISMGEHAYKRKGIAYRASMQLLAYAFQTLDLNKVYLNVDADNVSACALYEKLGLVCEGVFVKDMLHRGRWIDRKRYAVLKEMFEIKEAV